MTRIKSSIYAVFLVLSLSVATLSSRAQGDATAPGSAPAMTSAPAAAPVVGGNSDQTKGLMLNVPIFLALFGIFWFGIIRPQRQQQKQQGAFLGALKKGDEVITAGGLIGKVVGLNDRVVTLEISQNTEVKVIKSQVQAFLKEALPATAQTASK